MREPFRVCWVGGESTPNEQARTAIEGGEPPLEFAVESADRLQAYNEPTPDDPDCFVLDGTKPLEQIDEVPAFVPVVVIIPEDGDVSAALDAGAADVLRRETVQTDPTLVARRLGSVVEANAATPARTEETVDSTRLRQYQTLVEQAADPMYVLDSAGRCVLANDALARFSGYERDVLVGTHASTFIGRADFERASEVLAALVGSDDGSDRFEFSLETVDGAQRVGEATVTPITSGDRVLGSVGVIRDVSERARRTRELIRYRTIVETAPIGLFALDEAGTITWANDEFVGPFDEPAEEIVGAQFASLVERGYFGPSVIERYADHVRLLLSSENDVSEITHEPQLHTRNGETKNYRATLKVLPLEDGEFTGTVNAFREVTEERRYQRELERQNDRLEQFASLVSHDLRNPLNVAQGHADRLDDDHNSVSEVTWALDRMSTLIDDLLTLAKQGETVGETERVELATVVEDAWAVVDGPATLDFDGAGTVSADRSRLCELFTNLFRNGIDHALNPNHHALDPSSGPNKGGPATGGLPETNSEEDTPALQFTVGWLEGAEPASAPVGFFVEDDGTGLPDVDVFEAGVTTDPEGTGIGLAIVDEIAEAHGWTVTAGESPSGGARFEIRGVEPASSDASAPCATVGPRPK